MFNDELEIALHRVALGMDEGMDVDIMDIEGLCVPFDDYDYDTVPRSIDFDAYDGE